MKKSNKTSFWFHYDKLYARQFKVDKWLFHYKGQSLTVDSIKCYVSTFSRNRKKQPKVVMHGKANIIKILDGCVIIR
jgi:hypothetical protein